MFSFAVCQLVGIKKKIVSIKCCCRTSFGQTRIYEHLFMPESQPLIGEQNIYEYAATCKWKGMWGDRELQRRWQLLR